MNLQIDGIIFSLQKYGGISVYFRQLLSYLKNQPNIKCNLSIEFPVLQKLDLSNDYSNINVRSARYFERYLKCKISSEINIFHSSYYRLPSVKSIPSVVTVHDFIYEYYGSGLSRKVHMAQKHAAIRQAASIICVSYSTYEDMLSWVEIRATQSVHIIHNGVNPLFRPIQSTNLGRPFILFVGQRGGYKNFQLLLKVLPLLSDFELHCVGGGCFLPDEFEGISPSLKKRIRHLGFLTDYDLNLAYNSAFCLVYPSSYEGFGIPVVEAMRAGCPVVALRCKAIMEVGGDALEFAVCQDPGAIANAVLKLFEPLHRSKKIFQGIERARLFDWDKCHAQTFNVYKQLSN